GQAPDHVGLGVGLLGEELGGDDAGGIAHPLDLDIGIVLVEARGVLLEVVGLHRRVDGEGRLGAGPPRHQSDHRKHSGHTQKNRATSQQSPVSHAILPSRLPILAQTSHFVPAHHYEEIKITGFVRSRALLYDPCDATPHPSEDRRPWPTTTRCPWAATRCWT